MMNGCNGITSAKRIAESQSFTAQNREFRLVPVLMPNENLMVKYRRASVNLLATIFSRIAGFVPKLHLSSAP